MDEARLREIEAGNEARTPGEWCQDCDTTNWVMITHNDAVIVDGGDNETNDAAFIAACSVDVPDMAREIRRCWLVIDASEKTGIKLAGDIKKLLEGMAKLTARIAEKEQRITEIETQVSSLTAQLAEADAEVRRLEGGQP